MTGAETAVLIVSVLVASTTQVTVGFGFALLSVPLMALALPTREAVVVSTLLGLVTSSFQAWHGRRDAERDVVVRMVASALVGLPLGWLLFTRVDDDVLRALLGVSVILAVLLLATNRVATGSRRLDVVCGALSGALASSLSTNGPPLVFALQARGLSMSAFRPTINTVFTVSGVVALTGFVVSDDVSGDALIHSLMAIPVLLLGSRIGFVLRGRVPETGARRLVLALLALAGMAAILTSVL